MTWTIHPMMCGVLDGRQRLRRRLVLGGMAAAVTVPLSGCGGGAEVLFAPFFVFSYEGVIGRLYVEMSFSPATTDQSSGNFDSSSQITLSDLNGNSLSATDPSFLGSFNGRDLQLTLAQPVAPLVASYRGRFIEDDAILLTPTTGSGEAFTVRRNENDAFVPTLTGDWVGSDGAGSNLQWRLDTEPLNRDDRTTVLLQGTEIRGSAASVSMTGFANIRYFEMSIARAGGSVRVTGRLQPSTATPVPGTSQTTATIVLDGGGSLTRRV